MIAGLIFAVMASATLPPRAVVQSYDQYKSWLVACDNTLICVAKGLNDDASGAQITLKRLPGPTGKLELEISAEGQFGLAAVRIDGRAAGLSGTDWTVERGDGLTTLRTDHPAAVRALVTQLRNASKVSFGAAGANVSLAGLAAALLRIDEQQGRIGGVTALARPGPAPADKTPPGLPVPRIAAHPITARLAPGEAQRLIATVRKSQQATFKKEDCESEVTAITPEAHALDGEQALVLMPCLMGAYQGSSLAFVAPRAGGASRQLALSAPYVSHSASKGRISAFTNADFDPKSGTLSMSAKGRGLADCGFSASWIWNGTEFRLSALAQQDTCGGVNAGEWPTLFRSVQ